jgi:hypothetical protein
MSITVNLSSAKSGELKRFLDTYYQKEGVIECEVERWIYVCRQPLDAVDMISALLDNYDSFQISMSIQVNEGAMHHVTLENHNDVIRGMFELFYPRSATSLS